MIDPEHLGDGAYVHITDDESNGAPGGLAFTANHHDPTRATDRVYLDGYAVRALVRYMEKHALLVHRP